MKVRYRRPLFNLPMVARVLGWLLLIESVFLCIASGVSWGYHEPDACPLTATAVLTALTGVGLGRGIRPQYKRFAKRDGFLLTSSVWVVFSLFGMLPFIYSVTTPCSVTDGFFESMSCFTTTGSSDLGNNPAMSHGLHLWRALMQWVGGLGIILFTLAVLPALNSSGGMQMFNAEMTGLTHDKIRPRVSQTAKSLWGIYLLLTLSLGFLLWLGPLDVFDSICTACGTVSTAGNFTGPTAITGIHETYVKIVVIIFMFFGGVNFALLFRTLTGDPKPLLRNDVFKIYCAVIGVMWLLFIIAELWNYGWRDAVTVFVDPLFQVVAVISSTGVALFDGSRWNGFVLTLTLLMMFFGGCAGSTSGGAKIDRMLFLVKNTRNELYRCVFPNSVQTVKVGGRVASPQLVGKVIAFLCIYVMVAGVGGLILTMMDVPLVDALFSSFACASNVGISADITGVAGNFSFIPWAGKWVLAAVMLIGRLEVFTVLVLLVPAFWRR